jgi:hypothetical protein
VQNGRYLQKSSPEMEKLRFFAVRKSREKFPREFRGSEIRVFRVYSPGMENSREIPGRKKSTFF